MDDEDKCMRDGCRAASTPDGDGMYCEKHYRQLDQFVWLEADGDAGINEEFERLMLERGWDVKVRAPRADEMGGRLHYLRRDGTLQVLGFSIPVPESYKLDAEDCWSKAQSS